MKKALETNNTEEIKQATEKLTTVFYQISEQLYKQNAEAQGAANAGTAQDGNIYDADYKVENDDNNDNQ